MTVATLRMARTRLAALPAWAAPAMVGSAGLAAVAMLAVVDPNEPGNLPPCPFRTATGLDCPGCGTLRAMHALTRGDLLRALDHNVLTVAFLPVLLGAFAVWAAGAVRTGRRALPQVPAPSGYVTLAVVVTFWVVRNLPWWPLTWLGSGAS